MEKVNKQSAHIINNNNIGNQNNVNNNIENQNVYIDNSTKIIIINKPGTESITDLNQEEIEQIFDKEVDCLFKLIEFLNFNERLPQNHSFCLDRVESAYMSVYNPEQDQVDKIIKRHFIGEMISHSADKLNLLYKKYYLKLSPDRRKNCKERIDFINDLSTRSYSDNLFQQHMRQLAVISHNNREMVKNTWKTLSEIDKDEIKKIKQSTKTRPKLPEYITDSD